MQGVGSFVPSAAASAAAAAVRAGTAAGAVTPFCLMRVVILTQHLK